MNITCPQKITCPCTDSPIENLSSEAIDRRTFQFLLFTGVDRGGDNGYDGLVIGEGDTPEEAQQNAECEAYGCLGTIEPTRICAEEFYFESFIVGGHTVEEFRLTSGSLPPGLTLDEAAGTLSGIPTTAGLYSFQITAITDEHVAIQRTYSLTVVEIITDTLPGGTVGSAYSTTLSESGSLPLANWAVTSGALPPGLALNEDTGTISGIPSAAGTYSFTITLTDENPFTP